MSCECACRVERLPGLFFSLPGYLVWQRPFRAKLRVKKSLWKEILLILLWESVGVRRGSKVDWTWLQHSDELPPPPLCLSLFSVSLLFFSCTKSYASIYFSLPVFFYFFLNQPAAIWKIEEPHDRLPCFLHEAGLLVNATTWDCSDGLSASFFFLNLSASFNKTAFLSL